MGQLWFGPGDPVRAASAIARFGDGWLVAQDDANHAAWWHRGAGHVDRVRLLPAVDGRDTFDEASGTKHLKADLEAACAVGEGAVLVFGSGSLPRRTRVALVRPGADAPEVRWVDLGPLYARVSRALELAAGQLNLEGACVVGDRLRWFQRGHGRQLVASASVDVDLADLLAAVAGERDPASVRLGGVERYDLGRLGGLDLAITDAVRLPGGTVCVAATAEDAADAVADGPVAGSVLATLDPDGPTVVSLPAELATRKVEGLAVDRVEGDRVHLLAVVDEDDPTAGSVAAELVLAR